MKNKILTLTLLLILLATPCYAETPSMTDIKAKGLKELKNKRTYNQKVFDVGNGQQRYLIHTADIHYKKDGKMEDIDVTITQQGNHWVQSKASFHSKIPQYANEWFEFYNAYEGADHTIKAKPVCDKVEGVLLADQEDGFGHQSVLYKDAFGPDIDLRVFPYWAGLKKLIIIREKPVILQDLDFEFELDLPNKKVKDKDGKEWDKQTPLNFKGKKLLIGDNGKESVFRKAIVWDSSEVPITEDVEIQLYKNQNKTYLRKTITKEFLEKAVYPVYTDHPTNYPVGAGDGYMNSPQATWNTAHDSATGSQYPTGTVGYCGATIYTGPKYIIFRIFLPTDTSGIDDGADITDAVLYCYVDSKDNSDNDGNDWINVIQTDQPDPTTLTGNDFNNCGATNNPTEGATRIDFGNITAGQYNSWTLNAPDSGTGCDWIKKTAGDPYTMLGIREGHDCTDRAVVAHNYMGFRFSEYANTGSDPYLDVTIAIAAATKIFMVN